MHRAGKVEKKKGVTVQKEADAEEEIGVSEMVESTEVEEREPSLSDLMSILQAHMGQQEAREARQEEVTARQEQKFKALQHQFQLLQLEVQSRTSPVPELPLPTTESSESRELPNISSSPHAQAESSQSLSGSDFVHLKSGLMRTLRNCMLDLKICTENGFNQKVWIREHNPSSAAKAAELAEVFVAARRKGQPWTCNANKMPKEGPKSDRMYHQRPVSADKTPVGENQFAGRPLKNSKKIFCYLCGLEGHTKPMCPKTSAKMVQMCFMPRPHAERGLQCDQTVKMIQIEANGTTLTALLDSGSSRTLIHRDFVPPNIVRVSDTIPICCVHGDEKMYSTADMYIKVNGQIYLLNVGVVDNLPYSAILGRDFPVLFDLLESDQNYQCNVAVTRAQAQKSSETSEVFSALPFFNEEWDAAPGKPRKSRRQRRQEKFQHTIVHPEMHTDPDLPLGLQIPGNIIELQKTDPSLTSCFQRAVDKDQVEEVDINKSDYVLQNGILYHQVGSLLKLVVPQEVRETVLNLGHSIPWAGHLGKHKTTARIKQHFFWPGLYRDVAYFCKSCPQCQMTSSKVPSKAPLQPLPIIGTPI
ncbi:uncharacterized protein LOC112841659 isoform X1 [Oreochromis niloticus]|uniref:uncharacterized protein LOC112841659 isoform X1 n=1 Tax=Oreochromis niloticus TaxID=8128 RepID=UPI000DF4A599|nr:uncharacterized protein LOC112841659 isoform X1 [Oreochromis niloticus]